MPQVRRERILEMIRQNGNVTNEEIKRCFKISDMTVYRDLKSLQEQGYIRQVRGGAIDLNSPECSPEYEFVKEKSVYNMQKQAIAARAMEFIHAGMNIAFDNSSTVFELVKLMKNRKDMTVFTTGRAALNELSNNGGLNVYSCGGLYSKKTDSFIGTAAERFLSGLTIDLCAIGAMGISPDYILTDPLPAEARIKRKIIENSKTVILLAVSKKIGRAAVEKICGIDRIDYFITDGEIERAELEKLKKLVNVIVCPSSLADD